MPGNASLQRNMKPHAGNVFFTCNQCGKRFFRKDSLALHLLEHTREQQFQCSQCGLCGQGFTTKNDLILHLMKHTEERPYQCNQCDKSFKLKYRLTSHLKMHSRVSLFRYQCIQCDKSFRLHINLINHQGTHSSEKPYECSKCDKNFSQKVSLISHLKAHTSNNAHQCSHCGQVFSNKVSLISHMRIGMCKSGTRGAEQTSLGYISSDEYKSQNKKYKTVEKSKHISDTSIELDSSEKKKLKIDITSDFYISSELETIKMEEQTDNNNYESDYKHQPKIEIKDEPIVFPNN